VIIAGLSWACLTGLTAAACHGSVIVVRTTEDTQLCKFFDTWDPVKMYNLATSQ
jgi:hypothetical protein